jgi:hypothetical protein
MVIAWIFAVVTVGSCAFVGLPGYSDSKGLGLFSVDINGNCVRYGRTIWYEPDGARSAGQAFGTLTCLALSFGLVTHVLVIGFLRDRLCQLIWWTTRVLLAIAFLCSMFTFSFYSSTLVADVCESADDCVLGPAGSVGVMNVWLLLGIFTLSVCIPIPERPFFDIYYYGDEEEAGGGDHGEDKVNMSFETPKRSNTNERKSYRAGVVTARRGQELQQQQPEGSTTEEDEDLTNRHSRSSSNNTIEDDFNRQHGSTGVAPVAEMFRSSLFAATTRTVGDADGDPNLQNHTTGNVVYPSLSLRSSKSEDLDDEAVDRAFNPYGYQQSSSQQQQPDAPSIVTVPVSLYSPIIDHRITFQTGLPADDEEAQEEPSHGQQRRPRLDPC